MLLILLVVSAQGAWAQSGEWKDHAASGFSGSGTRNDPWVIKTANELAYLAKNVSDNKVTYSDKYFILGADIDLGEYYWNPIGRLDNYDYSFKGKFDGRGHVISNMTVLWNDDSKLNRYGLFSALESGAEIYNLVIDNAKMLRTSKSSLANEIVVAVLAGAVRQNTKVRNIIVRNSEITAKEVFDVNDKRVIAGGLVGTLSQSNNHIFSDVAVETNINLSKLTGAIGTYFVGGISGEWKGNSSNPLTNAYYMGQITNPTNATGGNSIIGDGNYKPTFCTNTYRINDAPGNNDQAEKKSLSAFATQFVNKCNDYNTSNNFTNLLPWFFDNSTRSFALLSAPELTIDYKDNVIITASTIGLSGSESYNWYISEDNITWKKSNLSSNNTLSLPYEGGTKYVYAELVGGTGRSNSVKISTVIKANATITKTNNTTYAVNLTNSLWDDDNTHLDVSYEWMVNGNPVTGATNMTFTPSGSGKVSCHIKVKAKESSYTILDRTLYMATVVFLDPERGNNGNTGMDDLHPVKTWQKAYSLLNDKATWDENTIVLMSKSNKQATSDNEGFSITTSLQNNNQSEKYSDWKNKVDASHLAKNVTITGKYNGKVYPAVIENYGYNGQKYLGIFGDTRFEYITFNHASGAGHSDYIFCQYNNLEMGEGIQMTNYNPSETPGYGGIDGAKIFSMQIYGGFNNDARFHKNNEVLYNKDSEPNKNNSLEAMDRALPHGKEGFSITLKSGRYSSVCVGGRQSGEKLNGLMGTPNMPLKCTITLDIDREWNDEHNQGINGTKADYDCGIILAGCQEGAMYADVDIIVKSGYVARIVSGTEGNKIKNYQGNVAMPANTYAGRANILIDPRKGNGEIDNGKVIVTELYGGSTGRGYLGGNILIDNPVYGYSTITINGGTFKILPEDNARKDYIFCGIFGAGAGGYNGIGDGTHHTPDEHIAYWGSDRILFGNYDTAKNDLVTVKCYNANDNTYTIVDPRLTNT